MSSISARRRSLIRYAVLGVFLVVIVPMLGLALLSGSSKRPTNLGVVAGRLTPCPTTPNCVCSQDPDAAHKLQPLRFSGTPAEALQKLKAVLAAMPRTVVVTATDSYLHVEFTTAIFRFVDDVEFLTDAEHQTIHFRSASRVGKSDLGTNRRRMEAIRKAFDTQAN